MRASVLSAAVAAVSSAIVAAHVAAQEQPAPPPELVGSSEGQLRVEQIATLQFPWGMALLPDGRILITEKPGRLRIFDNGSLSEPIDGVPDVVYRGARDQGGLLDVAVDPEFAQNRYIYLSYVEAEDERPTARRDTDEFRFPMVDLTDNVVRGGAVVRARLNDDELTNVDVIWRQDPKTIGRGHFGHRLVFAPDGTLFITSGDRMRFEPAQNLDANLGKVVRINSDGSIPSDNPFAGEEGVREEIWSYGHRNMLSAAIDPRSGNLWVVEMGPLGGDELNMILPGQNYGWPLVSNGDHYVRPSVPEVITAIPGHGTAPDKFVAPVRSWSPVISPSGAAFYEGEMFPAWIGDLLIGGLSSQSLIRLRIDGERVAIEERIALGRRIRDVLEAPDGAILLLVDDANGGLLRLTPAEIDISQR